MHARLVFWVFGFWAVGCNGGADTTSSAVVLNRHLLLTLRVSEQAAEIVDHRIVAMSLPQVRAPEPWNWRAALEDEHGNVIHRVEVRGDRFIRGEFEGTDGRIDSTFFRRDSTILAVRLPILPNGKTLRLLDAADVSGAVVTELGHIALGPEHWR